MMREKWIFLVFVWFMIPSLIFPEIKCLYVSRVTNPTSPESEPLTVKLIEWGYDLTIISQVDLQTYQQNDYNPYNFIFIDEVVQSQSLELSLLEGHPIPLFTTENYTAKTNILGYCNNTQASNIAAEPVTIVNGDHPLAAGFETGSNVVIHNGGGTGEDLIPNLPEIDFIPIAQSTSLSNLYIAYGIEKGITTVNGILIQNRGVVVGFHSYNYAEINDNGFALIKAGIEWITETQHPTISHTPPASATMGQDVTITADIGDDVGIVTAVLYYRRGGDTAFTSTSMSETGGYYQGIIPNNVVSSRGIEYFIQVQDTDGLKTRSPVSGLHSLQVNVSDPGAVKESAQSSGTEQTAYRLFSVPLDLNDDSPESVLEDDLGAYDRTQWRFFSLLSDQTYAEYSNGSSMESGKSFWLIVKNSGKVIDTGAGKSILTSEEYTISLHPGWNFAANPFNFSIPISNVRTESGASLEFRTFNGSWNDLTNDKVTTLEPFEGYAVYNNSSSNDQMVINPDVSSLSKVISKELASSCNDKNISWGIHILAKCQEARDIDNIAEIRIDGLSGRDEIDRPEPPFIGEYVSIYFPHPEWGSISQAYCLDARPLPTEGEIWTFEVKTNIRDEVKLKFEGIGSVPRKYEIWLLDEVLKISQDLRVRNRFSFVSNGTEKPKRLKLVVGTPKFSREKLDEIQILPTSYELYQNFPNPFNPVTTIRYSLPKNEKVTLKVFNIMGEEVVTLIRGEEKSIGNHTEIWNGRNSNGIKAATGEYFIQLSTGKVTQIRKMLLLE